SGKPGTDGIKVYVNGKPQGQRDRGPGALRMENLFLGARYYSNDAVPPHVSGFLDGDVAEVLLYDRLLTDAEHQATVAYLSQKHASYSQEIAHLGEAGQRLRSLENPPDVQVFVPGFTARSLPLDLTNINNIRYREDGKVVALAYDGNVYLLSD